MEEIGRTRIVLVSATAPGDDSVGAIYLRDLIASLPEGSLVGQVVVGSGDDAWPRVASVIDRGVTHVWVVLESRRLCEMAVAGAAHDVRIVTTVWDPPERFAHVSGEEVGSTVTAFEAALDASSACGVVSDAMRRLYGSRHAARFVIVRQGVDPALARRPARELPRDGVLRLGFAGSLYSRDAWDALLCALDNVDWRIAGRAVSVELFGAGEQPWPGHEGRVRAHGWIGAGALSDRLASVDACYLPSWFSDDERVSAELCFPSKLATYVATGRPVLVHAPEYSSVARFARRHGCALVCASVDRNEILGTLAELAGNGANVETMTRNASVLLDGELGMAYFRERFHSLFASE